jgi:hypothetical protein
MPDPSPDQPPVSTPDPSRSGDDVAEAIGVAERGTALDDLHTDAEGTASGRAPVERAGGDPDMTEGQVVHGADDTGGTGDRPETESSGAAQSVRGARASDLRAAGEQP